MWALIIFLPSNVYFCLYVWHSWIEVAHDRPYAFHVRLVPRLTYGLHRIKVASRVSVSPTVVERITRATRGGVNRRYTKNLPFSNLGLDIM
jgi:hypothetical protein